MKSALAAFALILLLLPSAANAETMPPGCYWQGSIGRADETGNIGVTLEKLVGTCTDKHGACGKVGEVIFVAPLPNDKKTYYSGQGIDIWVVGTNGTFTLPACISSR